MRIRLNLQQKKALQPFLDRVRSVAQLGSPGMLVAQIQWSDQDGALWLTPAFLPNELAKVITEKGIREIPGDTRGPAPQVPLTPGLVINSDTTIQP